MVNVSEIITHPVGINNAIKSKYNFITRSKNKTSNDIMDEFEYVFTDFSTLGVENLSKGGKTGFIFAKPDIYSWHTVRIGGLENFNLQEFLILLLNLIQILGKKLEENMLLN